MNRAKRVAFSLILFFALVSSSLSHGESRKCAKEPVTTPTSWGGNIRVEIDLRDKPMSNVRGIVEGPGDGTYTTLVQAFRRRPQDPLYIPANQEHELPVAACRTGTSGFFSFTLPSGEYELRMSQNPGVDVTSVLIVVEHGSSRSEKIRAVMHVGT
ncbi:MAG: hypothetical protein ABR976_19110 [Terracidiphilus sp.]|jgi:hypothetical protein